MQEIFQRTMRSRLESFKSAKMGVAPPKHITKHPKKEQQQKVRRSKETDVDLEPGWAPGRHRFSPSRADVLTGKHCCPQTPAEKSRSYHSGDEGVLFHLEHTLGSLAGRSHGDAPALFSRF